MKEIPMMMKSFLMPMVIDESKNQSRRIGDRWKRVKVGDRVWMREAWRISDDHSAIMSGDDYYLYLADFQNPDPNWKWRPAVHMTREACRFVGEVVGVRQEYLQDITPEDAIAEGMQGDFSLEDEFGMRKLDRAFEVIDDDLEAISPEKWRFALLMECMTPSIWALNPVVTVVEWRKV